MPIASVRKRRLIPFLAACATALGLAEPAMAVDVNSADYVPAPAGTSIAAFYTTYTTRGSYKAVGGSEITQDTNLESFVAMPRLIHYMDIGGITVAPQVLAPVGTLFNGKLGGASLKSTGGAADVILAAPIWFGNNAQSATYFAITPYLFVPVGSYKIGDPLNLGENRWKFDLQAGLAQGLSPDVLLQVTGDVMWYGTNSDAIGRGIGRLEQDNTYQLQTWLSYIPPSDKTWRVAVGYSKYWGGQQRLNGALTGAATESDQIRFELSKFVTPDFQILGQIQHDIAATGGFREDLRATIRLLKIL